MTDRNPHSAERVFISYSHDSPEHLSRVRGLSDRLRQGGVDCVIDQYVAAPPEGWPQWMRSYIREASHVLIVCTETYQRRLDLREDPGRGHGATWEGGLITLAVYEVQGRNDKFVPVVFSAADSRHIPDFLRGATWYDVSTEEGYTALYARLTGQQLVPVPPLGPRRAVGAQVSQEPRLRTGQPAVDKAPPTTPAAPATVVLLECEQGQLFIPAERIEEREGRIGLTLLPRGGEDAAYLGDLKPEWGAKRVWVAFGDTAHEATVQAADRSRDAAGERWKVVLVPAQRGHAYPTEVGTTGKSADDIAELRARRILLDERPPEALTRWSHLGDTLEMLVRGLDTSRQLTASPFPSLHQKLQRKDFPPFLAAAKSVAVLELGRTGTVEHVLELDLRMEGAGALQVHFIGRRRKVYTNLPAHEITVNGMCKLTP